MLMSPKFKTIAKQSGTLEFKRAGLVTSLVVPETIKDRMGFDANIEGNQIVFSEGDSIYILTDSFGLIHNKDEVDANIFFVDGGVVIELIEGKILLKGANDEVYLVDETGEIDYPDGRSKYKFVTSDELFEKACTVMKHRYSTSLEMTANYVENLVINVIMAFSSTGTDPVTTIRFATQYEDLGLGIFQFVNYGEASMFDTEVEGFDGEELVDVEDEEEEEEEDEYNYRIGEDDDD